MAPRVPSVAAPPPARVERLAVLPVFLSLDGKDVLVAGGTEAAAWKAELLHAAGARVQVAAAGPCAGMAALLAAHGADGGIVATAPDWRDLSLDGFHLAVADLEGEDAAGFATAARAAGVPVNVVDRPELCAFQFGSIVNRSPVVVGISTDGAAPVLAQAIRRRIETVLPRHLAAWGALAARVRRTVAARLPVAAMRRAFWERFADRAFAAGSGPSVEDEAEAFASCGGPAGGRVTLVGAGPGDPEYLTLKGMRALQSADVILFDDLVSAELLEFARREAKRMLVGKRGGRESCRQEDINALMLSFARQGKRVVRLKAGDPSVFGRSGEEIAFLERAGIAVDVVAGITTASAMAAGLKTSLTHRDCAQSVRFVTGHSRQGRLPETLDWRAVADPTTTTVFYMGGRTAPEIAGRLMGEGMSPETPVVITANVSRADERRWAGPLSAMARGIGGIGYDDPVIIGIGRVFAQQAAAAGAQPLQAVGA